MNTKKEHGKIDWMITLVPLAIVIALCVLFFFAPEQSNAVLSQIRFFFGDTFGTYYLVIGLGIFILSLYIAGSKYGNIVLGEQNEKPKYSFFAWGSMMFTCGLAADILFYSFSEWVLYATDPHLAEMGSIQDWAGVYPLFHWSFIPWGFYLVLAVAFGFIPYLYCATRPYLSVVEVRPRLGARVSVARIRVNERLRLLDFSLQNYPKGMKPVKINLFYALSQLYSKPVTEDDDTLDYIPTQYIAEFVKRIGYDGIVFKSSLYNDENSVNVVIFNFDKCEAVGSVVYDVTRNDYTCEMEDPVSELRLNFHLQLTPDNN